MFSASTRRLRRGQKDLQRLGQLLAEERHHQAEALATDLLAAAEADPAGLGTVLEQIRHLHALARHGTAVADERWSDADAAIAEAIEAFLRRREWSPQPDDDAQLRALRLRHAGVAAKAGNIARAVAVLGLVPDGGTDDPPTAWLRRGIRAAQRSLGGDHAGAAQLLAEQFVLLQRMPTGPTTASDLERIASSVAVSALTDGDLSVVAPVLDWLRARPIAAEPPVVLVALAVADGRYETAAALLERLPRRQGLDISAEHVRFDVAWARGDTSAAQVAVRVLATDLDEEEPLDRDHVLIHVVAYNLTLLAVGRGDPAIEPDAAALDLEGLVHRATEAVTSDPVQQLTVDHLATSLDALARLQFDAGDTDAARHTRRHADALPTSPVVGERLVDRLLTDAWDAAVAGDMIGAREHADRAAAAVVGWQAPGTAAAVLGERALILIRAGDPGAGAAASEARRAIDAVGHRGWAARLNRTTG